MKVQVDAPINIGAGLYTHTPAGFSHGPVSTPIPIAKTYKGRLRRPLYG